GDTTGLHITDVQGTDATHYPLALAVTPDSRLHLRILFQSAIFDIPAVDALLGQIVKVLTSIATDPALPLARLNLLEESDFELIVPARGDHRGSPRTFADILTANRFPSTVALVDGAREFTYAEVEARSDRLAAALIELGAGPEDLVAVAIPRSAESVLAVWAVVKTGAAFLPVDPTYPAARIEHMLADSGAVLGLTRTRHRDELPDTVLWVDLDEVRQHRYARPHGVSRLPASVDGLAYAIYTSGSTGVPKGVLVPHRGLNALAQELRDRARVTSRSRVLHFSSPSFDASVLEYLLAFGVGATMVIVPPTVYGGQELSRIMAEEKVTHAFLTPTALASIDPRDVPDVGCVLTGGEQCPPALVQRWAPGHRFLIAYGPTEATVATDMTSDLNAAGPVTIGGPLRGVAELVLDRLLQPVPIGVAGELYIAGDGLARGYHRRAGLTAARFVANPYGEPGERMYRTGDVVRWTTDAHALEYLGRSDFQVKIRGFRVELGEIDAALTRDPAVAFAATLPRTTASGDTALTSYVLPATDREVDPPRLISHLTEQLPHHMVPATIVPIETIPRTPAGKLDRAALEAGAVTATSGTSTSADAAPPATPLEESIAGILAAVVESRRFGIDDNFFDAGGNSLSATRAVTRINNALHTDIGVRTLFDAPTPRMLAQSAVREQPGMRARPTLEITVRPEWVPVSPAQKRMWFLNQYDTASPAYNIPVTLRLRGSLNVTALHQALTDVIARHETLRTLYPVHEGQPIQHVLPPERALLDLHPIPVTPEQVPAHLSRFIGTGFDVTCDLPIRLQLLELDADVHVLTLVVHHICADGQSMGPLIRDVVAAYTARIRQRAPEWSPLPVQYADYTLWQHELLGSEDDPQALAAQQSAFWAQTLADVPHVLPLPTDHPRPVQRSLRGATFRFDIGPALHRRLAALSRRHECTMFMATHAALAVLLARLSDSADIVVGTPIAGRGHPALDDLVGMFVGTLVLRTRVDAALSFAALLDRARDADLGAFTHAELPFERVVEMLAPDRSTAHSPLFQVLLEYQNNDFPTLELPGMTADVMDAEPGAAKFDLQLTLAERFGSGGEPAGISAAFTYATDLFDPPTIEDFAKRLIRILDAVTHDPRLVIGDIDITDDIERHTVLTAWNAEGVDDETTLADRFTRTVQHFPNADAVTVENTTLSYTELSARANRLARHLISLGVGPESLVAVALPRSIDLIVTIVATIETGAGYLPLDIDNPRDRLAFMLADAAPVCVVTTSEQDSTMRGFGVPRVLLDSAEVAAHMTAIAPGPVSDTERTARLLPDAVAYAIYTSGSTGRPKGVVVSHRNVTTLFANTQPSFGFDEHDVWTMFHSHAFDFAVWELWGALLFGGRVVVVDHYTARTPEMFRELLRREHVSVLSQTPTAFSQLVQADRRAPGSDDLGLRHVVFGGESLDVGSLARWYDRHGDRRPRLVNMYGITETTVHVSLLPLDRSASAPSTGSPIGQAIPGLRVSVRDRRLHPVPPGVIGEMYVSGHQLARGYLDRPDLTAARFVADPDGAPGHRMYRTGDLARWTRQGQLEYLGRSDLQVQLRGFRIEPGEVESTLVRHPTVAQAVVRVRRDEHDADRLIGYVVPDTAAIRDAGDVDADEVLDFARAQLAAHMVPAALVVLDRLPLTANGKLDVKALPEPDFARHVTPGREPATPAEKTLSRLFAEVLGVRTVGVEDSFFTLGGDSIMAIQLVARAKAEGVFVSPRDVFERRSVAALAEVAHATDTVELEELPGSGIGNFPLTPIARWLLDRGTDIGRFSQAGLLIAPAGLDLDSLARAVQAVLDHHDILRARLCVPGPGSGPVIEVPPAGVVQARTLVSRIVVATVAGTQFAARVADEIDRAADRLDPRHGVMMQVVWFESTEDRPDRGRLLFVIHHLA
ncbi:non-ribosomal peptide synthetase, partial [Rhodococcus sp. T7]|uniref:non-ribosomal peptide synthetase n=1 Tax=Rhodococcus sp. T7 TaxID=627444 RepID=UPI00135B7760